MVHWVIDIMKWPSVTRTQSKISTSVLFWEAPSSENCHEMCSIKRISKVQLTFTNIDFDQAVEKTLRASGCWKETNSRPVCAAKKTHDVLLAKTIIVNSNSSVDLTKMYLIGSRCLFSHFEVALSPNNHINYALQAQSRVLRLAKPTPKCHSVKP